jgi:hypothetical protein
MATTTASMRKFRLVVFNNDQVNAYWVDEDDKAVCRINRLLLEVVVRGGTKTELAARGRTKS